MKNALIFNSEFLNIEIALIVHSTSGERYTGKDFQAGIFYGSTQLEIKLKLN